MFFLRRKIKDDCLFVSYFVCMYVYVRAHVCVCSHSQLIKNPLWCFRAAYKTYLQLTPPPSLVMLSLGEIHML